MRDEIKKDNFPKINNESIINNLFLVIKLRKAPAFHAEKKIKYLQD